MQTVVCSQRPAMVGKMPMVTALSRVLRLLRCALAFLVASENAYQRRVFGWVREWQITISCTSCVSKHIRSRHIFSGTAASSTDAESCKWVRKWRESCDARHASCMSPAIVGACTPCTLALLTVCHTFSRRMLMSSTLAPEITHAHRVISVCYINFQTWDLVMTVLLWMCVEKRANSARRFAVLGSFVGTMISGCLLLLW